MFKLFDNRQKRINPVVITVDGKKPTGTPNHVVAIAPGSFSLVFPSTAKEVSALRMAEHHVDKFAPEKGDGVLVSNSYLALLDAK